MARRAGVLAIAVLLSIAAAAGAGEVKGAFRLPKGTFCVGEPIVIEFSVSNGGPSVFAFDEGGDYRGTIRHEQYSFRVVNADGRDFTAESRGCLGGVGGEIRLEAGQTFRSWQLLNGWVHLLPPGRYRVHCERRLSADPWPESADKQGGVEIAEDLSFEVTPYDKQRIVAAVAAMKRLDESLPTGEGQVRLFGVPVGWACEALKDNFAIAADSGDREFEKEVLAALPEAWDDRYYLEYGFEANRNWLTPEKPEEFRLTFSARNNGTTDLPHRFADSSLSVDGVAVASWPDMVKRMLKEKKSGETLAPGSVAEISGTFNEILPAAGRVAIVWTIRDQKMRADVRFGQ